ncbi:MULTISPECIES: serpin family protein [unclassified Modestobacter]
MTRPSSLLGALGVLASLTACASAGATPEVHRGEVRAVPAGEFEPTDVAAAQRTLGLDLLHAVCAQTPEENVLLSATSAAEALTLLYPAAGGPTATALGDVLHLPPWSPELVAALRQHTAALDGLRYEGDPEDDDAPDSLQLSNHLYTARGLQPAAAYLDDLATSLDADVQALDFAGDPAGATERINATVEEDTRGLIEDLFDQPLPSDTQAVLANALHLRARWASPFNDTATHRFAAPAGARDVDMMTGAGGDHRAAAGWQSVELPYRDGTLAAVAVLPPEGTDPCSVDAAVLAGLDAATAGPVGVRLPRLELAQTHDLRQTLAELGVPPVGDYPALGGELDLAAAVQRAVLRVDEDGTEAAAATGMAVAISGTAGPRATVTFDRPFLLLLTDTATRSPLLTAVVQDPAG